MKRRPLHIRVARRLLRPIRAAFTKLGVYSDFRSLLMHNRLLARSEELGSMSLCAIRVRELNNHPVYCRPNTTDVNVFDDTFFGRYHLPPRELGPIRTILDLGSNIGLTVMHYAVLFPEARILGIEMDHDNYEICQRNMLPKEQFGPPKVLLATPAQ